MKKWMLVLALAAVPALALAATERGTVEVGGQAMLPIKDIVDNAVNSADHTTLVAAVEAAGLVETLKGKGPFTVFAPTNGAFENLPSGALEQLLQPASKAALTRVLTYHLVPGRLDSQALRALVRRGGGRAELRTVSGGTLRVAMNGPSNLVLMDEQGQTAHIATYDVTQSNGVIHVLDRVVMPR